MTFKRSVRALHAQWHQKGYIIPLICETLLLCVRIQVTINRKIALKNEEGILCIPLPPHQRKLPLYIKLPPPHVKSINFNFNVDTMLWVLSRKEGANKKFSTLSLVTTSKESVCRKRQEQTANYSSHPLLPPRLWLKPKALLQIPGGLFVGLRNMPPLIANDKNS